jgi:hypothetical protein
VREIPDLTADANLPTDRSWEPKPKNEHAASVVVGLILMILGLGLGVTMIMLPVGIAIGLLGTAIVVAGIFARIDKRSWTLRDVEHGKERIWPDSRSRDMPVWGPTFRSLEPSDRDVKMRIANVVEYLESIQMK